jgi:putative FmdB family regulatory protein
MPIYEYACTACDHRVDILLGINDPGPHFCPSCGRAGTMRKLFAPPTIHYKGSGWAKKDRGGSSAGTKAASSSSSSGDGSGSGSGSGSSDASGPSSSTSSPASSSSGDGGSTPSTSSGSGGD